MAAHNKLSILSFELLVQFYHVNFPLELRKGTGQLQLAAVLMVDGGVPGWGECRVKLGRSPPQLSSSPAPAACAHLTKLEPLFIILLETPDTSRKPPAQLWSRQLELELGSTSPFIPGGHFVT